MRRLLTALCVLGTLLVAAASAANPASAVTTGPAVDVITISGLIDPVQADFLRSAIGEAEADGAQALVVQLNSGGGVLSRGQLDDLTFRMAHAGVPITIWVGPSGKARVSGQALPIARAAGIIGVAPGTHLGGVAAAEALRRGEAQLDAPTLVSFVGQLDGKQVGGRTIDTDVHVDQTPKGPVGQPHALTRFAKLGLLASLMHTVASPSVAYLLLVISLLLMVFEFYTAGIGVAAAVGAGCFVLACYGLTVLPSRPWAVALIVIAIAGYTIDLQAGAPRFWTVVGTVALVIGTVTLTRGPHLSWLAMIVGVAGTPLFMIAGMPAMVRTRFSTPTIGRESMVGEMGLALADVSPEGTVEIKGAQWRARTNRATPIPAGSPVRVVSIDGLLLEVEPETGGAREVRH